MVSGIQPKTHGMGKRQQFTERAIHDVIKSVQGHLDPVLKVSLNKGFPILVGTINRQRFHFSLGNVPIHANGFKDKVELALRALTEPAGSPF